jgi:cell volume regulation protein A
LAHGAPVLAAGLLLAAAVAASLTAGRLRLPGLILFLGIGMAVGSDGAGWIAFDDYGAARDAGMLALAVILFDGGLGTGVEELRPVIRPALKLAVIATAGGAALTGLLATLVLGIPIRDGLLVGAILGSTDSAAIFALVRGTSLRRRLERTLEGESGFNDPVAVLMVLAVTGWIVSGGWDVGSLANLLIRGLVGGVLLGMLAGRGAVWALEKLPLPAPGLYPVASLSAAAIAYGGAEAVGGSGFLAVYLAGLMLADAPIQARNTIGVFHEGAAWIAQIGLFLMLGLLVSPSRLGAVATEGIVLAAIALGARPVAALAATAREGFSLPERLVLGWAGLRGAVPVVLATLPVTAGVARASDLFNIVFIVVVITTLVQGTTLEPLARRLRVTGREPVRPRVLGDRGTVRRLGAEIVEYPVSPIDGVVGRQVAHLGLPPEATVNVIVRGREAIPPDGSVRIRAGDRLHLLVRHEVAPAVAAIVSRWEAGEGGRWS